MSNVEGIGNPSMSYSYSRRSRSRYRYEALGRDNLVKSISYRRRRAKQRQVFLTTYKLGMDHQPSNSKSSSSPKLKKVAVKVKKIVTSVLIFMRSASFSSCTSKSAISAP